MTSSSLSYLTVCIPQTSSRRMASMGILPASSQGKRVQPCNLSILSVIASARVTAVPEGASFFCVWCTSSIDTLYWSKLPSKRAIALFSSQKILTPRLKFDAQKSVLPLVSIALVSCGRASDVHPVVPHTTFTSAAHERFILSTAVCGVVNSRATSAERKASLSKSSVLSASIIDTISCPLPIAVVSSILPIFPYPISAIFIAKYFMSYTLVQKKLSTRQILYTSR